MSPETMRKAKGQLAEIMEVAKSRTWWSRCDWWDLKMELESEQTLLRLKLKLAEDAEEALATQLRDLKGSAKNERPL